MTIGGWILMTIAWSAILALTAWCIIRVLRTNRQDPDDAASPPQRS